jgi:hypothetical protein
MGECTAEGEELIVEDDRAWLPAVECERTLDDDGEMTDPSKESECGLVVYTGPDGSISTDSTCIKHVSLGSSSAAYGNCQATAMLNLTRDIELGRLHKKHALRNRAWEVLIHTNM